MFAIVRDTLMVLNDSMTLDGVIYTDLWSQTDEQLQALSIFRLPEQPACDLSTEKVVVNYDTKSWEVVPLTPEEIKENTSFEYNKYYLRLLGKYKHYQATLENYKNNQQLTIQLQSYLVDLAEYCLKVLEESIPLDEIIEYPEPILENFSNEIS